MTAKKSFFDSYIPAILWSFVVFALMCTPGKEFPNLGEWTEVIKLDKLTHICIFGLMAFLYMRPFSKKNYSSLVQKQHFLKIAIALSLWGLTTEFIQHFWIPGRTFDIFDWLADAFGCFAAFAYSKRHFLH